MAKQCQAERSRSLKPNQFQLPSGALITERPLLFQTDMVQAILEDRKTQTRRDRNLDHLNDPDYLKTITKGKIGYSATGEYGLRIYQNGDQYNYTFIKFPYGKPGDLLWVRETFLKIYGGKWSYKAGLHPDSEDLRKDYLKCGHKWAKWKPSIHMPKDASRIWLMIEDVRAERLQEISEEDARAEGIQCTWIHTNINYCRYKNYINNGDGSVLPKSSFQSLWVSINGAESWQANPWVWVVRFRVMSKTGKPSMEEIEQQYWEVTGKEVPNG